MDTTSVREYVVAYRRRAHREQLDEQKLLTVSETADYLGISENALRMMMKRGQISGMMKLGERKTRFNKRALDRWIERRTARNDALPPAD